MGGSVVTKSCPILLQNKYKIAGVSVLDVVEGSAVDALPHMNSILNARPDGFDSVEEAIEWQWVVLFSGQVLLISGFLYSCSVTTNTIQNVQSARISIPGIVYLQEGANPPYQWRTPLRSTAPYWLSGFFTFVIRVPQGTYTDNFTGWFQGLSGAFLSARTARLLVLAGTDRLDKELMIGQMQGKFQMEVVPAVGHMLHEVRDFSSYISRQWLDMKV